LTERIYKLQPDRTVYLRGFDHLGASAAVHSATPDGFKVSGCFRDAADFAVVVLYDADNYFEHPRLRYLPDFNFSGLELGFDVSYSNLMPLNSRKFPWIDWPYLDVTTASGEAAKIRLADHATVVANPDTPATAQFEIAGDGLEGWDRLTLWYQNLAFDYTVPGKVRTEYEFYAGTPGRIHSITVGGRTYAYTEQEGDGSAVVASRLIEMIAGDSEVSASRGATAWSVQLACKLDTGGVVQVSASGYPSEELYQVKATTVCRALRDQINGADYAAPQTPFSLRATATGTTLRLSTVEGGFDANFVSMYSVSKNDRLTTRQPVAKFSGGASTATLRVTLDFAALGLTQIRKMWLTMAPRLADGADYEGGGWEASFSNWTVAGPEEVKRLQVAGPDSVRALALGTECEFNGPWFLENGFYLDNAAKVTRQDGATVTVRYSCAKPHDLWVWTSLARDRGPARVEVDGSSKAPVDTRLDTDEEVITRRRIAGGLAAGDHVLRLTSMSGDPFYFVAAEAVVAGDVPDAPALQAFTTPALDYSTDHSYKLPPARIVWNLDKLGCAGELNEYIGILWWNERKRVGGSFAELRLQFGGQFTAGDEVFVEIGGQTCGKSVLLPETAVQIARHFALMVNSTMVAVWARVEGNDLVLRSRSSSPAYEFDVKASVSQAAGSTGRVGAGGRLGGGSMGTWEVDPEATAALNAGARAWHMDLYRVCALKGRRVTTAFSMELVNPPAALAARYPDGAAVVTDMGFGGLRSTHCAFSSGMLAFQKRAFLEVAGLMAGAGLTPDLQCGEFTWWYFTNWSDGNPGGGMAFYDAETAEAAQSALGRALQIFRNPNDDPKVNGGADAAFLRARLRDYAAAIVAWVRTSYPGARFEVLFPYDVNYPAPAGIHQLGGRLNRFVNLPLEWQSKVSSGFSRFKIESLDYGVWSRNLDLARTCLSFPQALGWPADSVRAMIGVFRGGYPWSREVQYAKELGMSGVSLWALDHVCLFGWETGEQGSGRSFRQG